MLAMDERPLIAVTTGDPAGIGPEVVLKAIVHPRILEACRPLVLGDADLLSYASQQMKLPLGLKLITHSDDLEKQLPDGALLHVPGVKPEVMQPGEISAENGRASLEILETAISLALSNQVAAIATGPIHKAALNLAGSPYRGHTQLLADRCGVGKVTMMLLSPGRGAEPHWLRVSHATTHIALKDVPAKLTPEGLQGTIELTLNSLTILGADQSRLAVAALNPHAGEEGLMGDEEIRWIRPFVERIRSEGVDASGPLPADTVFLRAAAGEFDAVIALYHDQGHIAVKMHGFENAVNLTLGLPIIRTSVDHGTAFDIAWQGLADESSMVEAIKLAARMATHKQASSEEGT
jgi:4-hydroxythreonine-4-phosphate dehydrogenase